MAVISNTAQGIGQPIRGTCLTSLGSTGIVAAWYSNSSQQYNDLIVPEFGTHLELTLVCQSTATGAALSNIKVWGRVPAEGANPSRNWPADYGSNFGMGPSNAELWVVLNEALTLGAPTHQFEANNAKIGKSELVALRGAAEIRISATLPTNGSHLIVARFVN